MEYSKIAGQLYFRHKLCFMLTVKGCSGTGIPFESSSIKVSDFPGLSKGQGGS